MSATLGLRLSRTWAFGGEKSAAISSGGSGGNGHSGGHSEGPVNSARRYNLTLTASTLNSLNHPNFAAPNRLLSFSQFPVNFSEFGKPTEMLGRGLSGGNLRAEGSIPSTSSAARDPSSWRSDSFSEAQKNHGGPLRPAMSKSANN